MTIIRPSTSTKIHLATLILGCFFLLGSTLNAQNLPEEEVETTTQEKTGDFGLAIGIKANTMGFGGEVTAQIKPKLHLRLGGTYYKYTLDMKPFEDFVKGEGYIKAGGISLLANWQLGRVFFLSAGGIFNLTEARVNGVSAKSVYVGSIEVQPEDVGFVDIAVEPSLKILPYAGLGIGRTISKNRVVSFAFELGAAYINKPKATLITTGMLSPTSSPEQVDQLNENLSWINLYPMVSFQLSFKII
jgi:hypothetical protein